jgi:hypothetical protein
MPSSVPVPVPVPVPASAATSMVPRVTSAQIAAVTTLTLLGLAAGLFVASIFGDMTMRATDAPMAPMAPMAPERTSPRVNAPVR